MMSHPAPLRGSAHPRPRTEDAAPRSPMTQTWEVVSVVVCYHDAPTVRRLCTQLAGERADRHAVVVIDHSTEPYRATWADEYTAISKCSAALMLASGNHGSAGGFRRGQLWALEKRADFVWLHDQDGAPHPGCLEELLATMRTDGNIAAAAPVVEDEHGLAQREFCGQRGWLGLPRFVQPPAGATTTTAAFVASAGLLLRSTALSDVGPYDDKHYFVGYEDFDFCARLAAAGWRIVVSGAARYRHPHLLRKHGRPWPSDPAPCDAWRGAVARHLGLVNLSVLNAQQIQGASPSALQSFRYFALKHAGPLAWQACRWSSLLRSNAHGRAALRRALRQLDSEGA
jgi:GT2 family glycosyltransferase